MMSHKSARFRQTSVSAVRDEILRRNLLRRAKLLSATRRYLEQLGFIEVDTPILRYAEDPSDNPVFVTLGSAGWPRLHLRTCSEEYTRRAACVFGKVFELGKSFRNERLRTAHTMRLHLAEFTILEIHQVNIDLEASMALLEDVLYNVISAVAESQVIHGGRPISFAAPFKRLNVLDALIECGDGEAAAFVRRHRNAEPKFIEGEDIKLHSLLDQHVRPHILQPTFLTGFPRSADQISCETRGNEVRRAELDCAGFEIGEVGEMQPNAAVLRQHVMSAVRNRHGEAAVAELVDNDYLAWIIHER